MKVYATCSHGVDQERLCPKCEEEWEGRLRRKGKK